MNIDPGLSSRNGVRSNVSIRLTKLFLITLVLAITSGCATTNNPKDPFEGYNRAMFKFNDTVDEVALTPAAKVYQTVLPSFVQTGVGNFFGNLADVWTAANNFMQGKVENGISDVMRVAVNSTLGLGGLLDIGADAGLHKHKEDFGQTLGVWGVKAGPYIVLPIFGSYTMREALVFPIDIRADPWAYKYPVRWRNVGTALRMVDRRATLLGASNLIEEAALDRYAFIRDAYMQRRDSLVNDGEAPYSNGEDSKSSDPSKDAPKEKAIESPPSSSAEPELIPSVSSDIAFKQLVADIGALQMDVIPVQPTEQPKEETHDQTE